MTNHPFQILLHGGPLNGIVHELWIEASWVLPYRVGLPTVGIDGYQAEKCLLIAWYDIRNGEGFYQWTENTKK